MALVGHTLVDIEVAALVVELMNVVHTTRRQVCFCSPGEGFIEDWREPHMFTLSRDRARKKHLRADQRLSRPITSHSVTHSGCEREAYQPRCRCWCWWWQVDARVVRCAFSDWALHVTKRGSACWLCVRCVSKPREKKLAKYHFKVFRNARNITV